MDRVCWPATCILTTAPSPTIWCVTRCNGPRRPQSLTFLDGQLPDKIDKATDGEILTTAAFSFLRFFGCSNPESSISRDFQSVCCRHEVAQHEIAHPFHDRIALSLWCQSCKLQRPSRFSVSTCLEGQNSQKVIGAWVEPTWKVVFLGQTVRIFWWTDM